MLADDFQHGAVGKSLFVIAEQGGSVDAGENCRLSGSALRAAFNPQAGVGGNHDSVEDCCRLFIAKNGQRFGIVEGVERIERSPRTNSQAVNEEK